LSLVAVSTLPNLATTKVLINRRLAYGHSYVAFAPSRWKRNRRITEIVAIKFVSNSHTNSISLIPSNHHPTSQNDDSKCFK
jgi:hypothetical protein